MLKANDCFFSTAVKHTRQTNWASNLTTLAVLVSASASNKLAEVEKVLCYSFRVQKNSHMLPQNI